jgi:hypothetical protein
MLAKLRTSQYEHMAESPEEKRALPTVIDILTSLGDRMVHPRIWCKYLADEMEDAKHKQQQTRVALLSGLLLLQDGAMPNDDVKYNTLNMELALNILPEQIDCPKIDLSLVSPYIERVLRNNDVFVNCVKPIKHKAQ